MTLSSDGGKVFQANPSARSAPADRVDSAFDWLRTRRLRALVPLVLVVTIVKYGIGLIPSWNVLQALAIHWRHPLASPLLLPPADFRLRTPVSAVLAGWLHLTSGPEFLGFHFALALLAIATPLLMPAVRESTPLRMTMVVLLVGGAIPAILVDWVGSYDPVTLIAFAVAVLARRRELAWVAWTVAAFNNAPETFFALVFTAVVLLVQERRAAVGRLIGFGASALLGYVLIRVLDHHWGGGSSEFTLIHVWGWSLYYSSAWHYWPLIALSALGVGWVFFTARDIWQVPAARALIGLAVLGSIGIPLIALDDTRLTAGILWPPALATAAYVVRDLDAEVVLSIVRRVAPIAAVMVIVVVWQGNLVYPGWHAILDFYNYLFGGKSIPLGV